MKKLIKAGIQEFWPDKARIGRKLRTYGIWT